MAEAEEVDSDKSTRKARKCKLDRQVLVKDEIRARCKQVRDILKKPEEERSIEEQTILRESPEVVKTVHKREKIQHAQKQRVLEIEDDADVLKEKCHQLALAIKASDKVVIYTGAGISTAASIPDYRGPNGVWTLLKQGKELEAQDLCDAEPTYTHMGIVKLYREGHLKHVVSQNCDGLHVRSGLPRSILSEVHGNMFIEQCKECKPHREYVRLFDTTEKTGVRRHETGRKCHKCNKVLRDTIVHFGEKGGLKSPYRWKEAVKAANTSELILCLGSSLKLLKKYSCLWCMDRRVDKRPNLYIVNLQWTPKDDVATLKINGRCDDVIQQVMESLGYDVPSYKRELDPIFALSAPLRKREFKTTSKKILDIPPGYVKPATAKRKSLIKLEDEQDDAKTDFSTIRKLLAPKNLSSRRDAHRPPSIVSPSLPIDICAPMQEPGLCMSRLSGLSNPVLPHFIPPNLPLTTPFQSAALSSSVLGGHLDLRLVSGMLSKHDHPPHDVPRLPGSVILDHCYCKLVHCKGECRTEETLSPSKEQSPQSAPPRHPPYFWDVQSEAMDLSNMADQPLDLSPRSRKHQHQPQQEVASSEQRRFESVRHSSSSSKTRPDIVSNHGNSLRSFDESKPPGLIMAAPILGFLHPQPETVADLQKYCMLGFPTLKSELPGATSAVSTASTSHSSVQRTVLNASSTSTSNTYVQGTVSSAGSHSVCKTTPAIRVKTEPATSRLKEMVSSDSDSKSSVDSSVGGMKDSDSTSTCSSSASSVQGSSDLKDEKDSNLDTDSTSTCSSSASSVQESSELKEKNSETHKTETNSDEEKSSKPTKRRPSSTSVPGWFGKGLAIKKRRRF